MTLGRWSWMAHLYVVWAFAVAQPLYDLLGRYPEFFVARRALPAELIGLVLALSLLGPIPILSSLLFVRRFSEAWFRRCLLAALSAGMALFLLAAVKHVPVGDWVRTPGALAAAGVLALVYRRSSAFRMFLSILIPVILVFPAVFLFFSPVEKILFPSYGVSAAAAQAPPVSGDSSRHESSVPGEDPPSVVMVVFDELALFTLLDEQGRIDARRFPNFAALAQDSTWYRNATTVGESTHLALPAIATGLYPSVRKLGNSTDYPDNLFTWLQPTHRLEVFESITQLCPVQLCPPKVKAPWRVRARLLAEDLLVVYGHLVLPTILTRRLPSVEHGWGNFRRSDWQLQRSLAFYKESSTSFDQLLEAFEGSQEPKLFFYHASLPHFPWIFLPSGKRYSLDNLALLFIDRGRWNLEPAVVQHAFQRYALQLAFTDHQLGRLLDRLKETGLYDRSVLVVLSDHGVHFQPGQERRRATPESALEIMPVPLFIRTPGQTAARTSAVNMETVDLLPTLADVLGIDLPFGVDGLSVINRQRDKPRKRLFRAVSPVPLMFDSTGSLRFGLVACVEGKLLRSTPGLVAGAVDGFGRQDDRLIFTGFAASLTRSAPAERVLLFVDGKLVAETVPGLKRPDVVAFFDDPGLLETGFHLWVDAALMATSPDPIVQVFGLLGPGFSELHYHADYPWETEDSTGADSGVVGTLDCQASESGGFITGLAELDPTHEASPFEASMLRLARSAEADGLFRAGPGSQWLGLPSSQLGTAAVPVAAELRNPELYLSVDPGSDFVPAEIDALLDLAPESETRVAVALNGVIRAVAAPFPSKGKQRLLAIVPEQHFRPGTNQLEFFELPP